MSPVEFDHGSWVDAARDGLVAACEAASPSEACGLVAVGAAGVRVVAIPNAAGAAAARERFELDGPALLGALRELDLRGERVVAFFHSHVERVAGWSGEDDRTARGPDGAPLWPGVEQVVVEVRAGRAAAVVRFRWEGGRYRRA